MDTDFVQTMVTDRRDTFLAEAANARLARIARRWRAALARPAPRTPRPTTREKAVPRNLRSRLRPI